MERYTLLDKIYRFALRQGYAENEDFEDNIDLRVVGGSATQLYTQEGALLRPTNDIDFAPSRKLSKQGCRIWGDRVQSKLMEFGHEASHKKTRSGHEVSLDGLDEPLFVHIDNYTPKFWKNNEFRIRAEDERSNHIDLDGQRVKVVRPEDVIAGKMKRLTYLARKGHLSDEEYGFFTLLEHGLFDDLVLPDLLAMATELNYDRRRNLEFFAKMDDKEREKIVSKYLARKDLYDAMLLVKAHQDNDWVMDGHLFVKATKEAFRTA